MFSQLSKWYKCKSVKQNYSPQELLKLSLEALVTIVEAKIVDEGRFVIDSAFKELLARINGMLSGHSSKLIQESTDNTKGIFLAKFIFAQHYFQLISADQYQERLGVLLAVYPNLQEVITDLMWCDVAAAAEKHYRDYDCYDAMTLGQSYLEFENVYSLLLRCVATLEVGNYPYFTNQAVVSIKLNNLKNLFEHGTDNEFIYGEFVAFNDDFIKSIDETEVVFSVPHADFIRLIECMPGQMRNDGADSLAAWVEGFYEPDYSPPPAWFFHRIIDFYQQYNLREEVRANILPLLNQAQLLRELDHAILKT